MSVNWNWNYKKGYMVIERENDEGKKFRFNVNIYSANCLGALIYDYKNEKGEDMYTFWGFWNDIEHLRNCLGISKKYKGENLYKGEVKEIRLNINYKDSIKIAEAFAKSGIKAVLYNRKVAK